MKNIKNKFLAYYISLLILVTAFLPCPVFAAQLSDISGNWAEKEIQYFADTGIIKGYEDGTFLPDRPVTRAEFAAIVNRTYNYETTATINFSDVKPGDWYYKDVQCAVAAGYIVGYTDNTFQPNRNISREETAIIIQRIIKAPSNTSYAPSVFSDVSSSSYYNGAIGAVTSIGVMKGITSTVFSPKSYETRADTAYSLYNARFNGTDKNAVVDGNVIVRENSYGPTSEYNKEHVSGNVYLRGSNSQTTIKNLDVQGDVIIESTARGVTLQNVAINGKLIVNGGTYLELEGTTVDNMDVNNTREKIVISASNDSECRNANIYTPCSLEEDSDAYFRGFNNVVINGNSSNQITVDLSGQFVAVDVYPAGTTLNLNRGQIADLYFYSSSNNSAANLKSGTNVDKLEVNAEKVSVRGEGIVSEAKIEAPNVVLQSIPSNLTGTYAPKYSYDDEYGNVEITVENNNGSPVNAATVKIFGASKTTDNEGKAYFTNIPVGTHEYSVERSGFTTVSGSLNVSTSKTTRTVSLTANSKYSFTLTVIDNATSSSVSSASVALKNSSTYSTASNGTVTFSSLDSGVYTYTITRSGYQTMTDTITINGNNESKTVRLVPTVANYSVDFTVRNATGVVPNASVKIGSQTGTTDIYGYTKITGLSSGTYTYTVTATGYDTFSGSINVTTNMAQTVTLAGVTYDLTIYVKDSAGVGAGILPTASVWLDNIGVGRTSDVNGKATFNGLSPGIYKLRVELTGYITILDYEIEIIDNDRIIDVVLTPNP